jgi:hypothetical protein
MIVVRLMGGLGNQMFQYAAALHLALRHATELKLDVTFLLDRTPRENFTFRDFDLVVFPLAIKIATPLEIRRFRRLAERGTRTLIEKLEDKLGNRHYYLERCLDFDRRVLELPDETYLEGYFQNEKYFEAIASKIRTSFHLAPDQTKLPAATRRLAEDILGSGGICLNVRRGDYVQNPLTNRVHGVCSKDYYQNALASLQAQRQLGKVFVFSDDVEWCRANFKEGKHLTIVGDEHAGERFSTKFWLMTLSRHFVIPNSTFAWWAAWLGSAPDKLVFRPNHWFHAPEKRHIDICPSAWVPIPND